MYHTYLIEDHIGISLIDQCMSVRLKTVEITFPELIENRLFFIYYTAGKNSMSVLTDTHESLVSARF